VPQRLDEARRDEVVGFAQHAAAAIAEAVAAA
jgi:hypothetical protein